MSSVENALSSGGSGVSSLSSTGASYLRKTGTAFRWCHTRSLPQRNLFVKAQRGSALLTEMSYSSVFSSSHMPFVPGSSPALAELGFSLGPQSLVCSQLSTSNTGGQRSKASRFEQRNIMDKTNRLHPLWVTGSGFHFLLYI